MNLKKAKNIGDEMVEILKPYSEIINIAGSIRREKPEVKDIEIVCAPKRIQQQTLFGEGPQYNGDQFKSVVKNLPGKIVHGKTSGRNLRMELDCGIILDLFMPQNNDYYRHYAIRTGSGDYSHKELASSWKRNGWVGTTDGLRRRDQCSEISEGKNNWRCYVPNPELPPVWESEEHFFDWLGLKWIIPQDRNMYS